MTYAFSAPLQEAVYQALAGDAALVAIVGANVFDAMPGGPLPPLYAMLGPERVKDASDLTGTAAWHDFAVSVVTDGAGFHTAKQAAAISDALHDADLALSRGRLVGLRFVSAQAKRESGGLRRIDLTFRARVEDN
ncbi:DUF3168 domain-containing protein [Aestuariicoccus sp. MJ-SS9]|uniref:DUF3168 domain-containing protein n=1 Tax=Aestuariicoccus sp. MJ-SS9 TaxID=3079855 RepID=UPI0029120238|nr:DUF3168 domain-containing protein [Aestuariicoccus sp. MJ-SS9]MDU8911069.1 DUF3168 domain-containing protein [Aestuariicoccus sp. MJ-SS9]